MKPRNEEETVLVNAMSEVNVDECKVALQSRWSDIRNQLPAYMHILVTYVFSSSFMNDKSLTHLPSNRGVRERIILMLISSNTKLRFDDAAIL